MGTGLRTLARTHAAIIGLLSAQSLISCDITSHLAPRIIDWYGDELVRVDTEAAQQPAELLGAANLRYRRTLRIPHPVLHPGLVDDLVDEPLPIRGAPRAVYRHSTDATSADDPRRAASQNPCRPYVAGLSPTTRRGGTWARMALARSTSAPASTRSRSARWARHASLST